MLDSLVSGFSGIAKRPVLIIPALVAVIVNFVITLLAFEPQADFFYSVFVLNGVVDAAIPELPYYLLASYPWEIFAMLLSAFASTVLWILVLYVYAESSGKGIIEAFRETLSRTWEMIGVAAFAFIAVFLYFVILFALFVSTLALGVLSIVGFLASILWILFGIYAGIRLVFTPAIMAVKRKKLKKALAESWKLQKKGTLEAGLFIVLAGAIAGTIGAFFSMAGEASGNEVVFLIMVLVGFALANAYYSIVFIKYVSEQKFSFSH